MLCENLPFQFRCFLYFWKTTVQSFEFVGEILEYDHSVQMKAAELHFPVVL